MSFTIKNGTIVHYEESGTLEKLKLKKTAEAVATPAKATASGMKRSFPPVLCASMCHPA